MHIFVLDTPECAMITYRVSPPGNRSGLSLLRQFTNFDPGGSNVPEFVDRITSGNRTIFRLDYSLDGLQR